MIPVLGSSPGEGIGYPLQYSWASLLAQKIKNPPAMRETWVQSLDWEDPLEEGKAIHFSTGAWRIPMDREAWQASPWSQKEPDTTEQLSPAQHSHLNHNYRGTWQGVCPWGHKESDTTE